MVEVGGVFVFGETSCVEHPCELGGFLGAVAAFGGDGIEVQGSEKGPFFVGRHEGVLHQLVESFEALYVYSYGVLVALLRSVKGILLRVAYPSEMAHGRFVLDVGNVLPVSLLALFDPVWPAADFPTPCAIS